MKINKLLKNTVLSATLFVSMATSFQANAIVGAVTGGPIYLALGAFFTGSALLVGSGTGHGAEYPFTVGIILLDVKNGQEVQFQEMTHQNLLNIGLTEDEAIAYNENTEELSTAFKVVSTNLTKDSTQEEAVSQWQEQEDILGSDTINGARKVLQFNIKK